MMKRVKKLFFAHMLAGFSFLLYTRLTEAQIGPPLSGVANLSVFTSWLIGIIVMILWPAIIILWCVVGFKFVVAQGNPNALEEARRALVWAVVGTAIVAGAEALKLVIEATINSIL